jgi:hypothetical protein
MRDLRNNIDAVISLSPAARNATANGAGVDLQGFEGAVALAQFGNWTDGVHTPSLQESDDNSTFANVAAADMLGSFAAVSSGAGANTVQRVGYIGAKRYVRAVMTVSGATTGALSAVTLARGVAARRPV